MPVGVHVLESTGAKQRDQFNAPISKLMLNRKLDP